MGIEYLWMQSYHLGTILHLYELGTLERQVVYQKSVLPIFT